MSDHSRALVPLEAWAYQSPTIRQQGRAIDIGLFSEALLYYEQVMINVSNPVQLSEFIKWFVRQNKYQELINLLDDETIQIYDYGFMTAAIEKDGTYSIWNIDDPISQKPNSFEERYLYHKSLDDCFRNARERRKLYKTIRGKVIEAKAKEFGRAIENARADYLDAERSALLIQALLDEIYPKFDLGKPPQVIAEIEKIENGNRIHFNIDLGHLSRLLGPNINFHLGTPLTGIAHCNRLLWSAATQNCDLYIGSPMSALVGDKLYESNFRATKLEDIIQSLNQEVEFPDIRTLANEGKLDLDIVFAIRKKAKKFRSWLQSEAERDRNAIIAYHTEIAKELGLVKFGRKSLRLFGILGGLASEAYISHLDPSLQGAIAGGAVAAGIGFTFELASKIGQNWKPIIFGSWFSEQIERVLKKV